MADIIDVLAHLGVDNIQYHNLDGCLVGMNHKHGHSEFAFASDQPFSLQGPEKLGLVLWLPRDKVSAAKEAAERSPSRVEELEAENAELRAANRQRQEQIEKLSKSLVAARDPARVLLERAEQDPYRDRCPTAAAERLAKILTSDLGETIIDRRIRGLEKERDEAIERRDHWFKERERELDENERLRAAMRESFLTPVSVQKGSSEEEELQVIYDKLGEALNWRTQS